MRTIERLTEKQVRNAKPPTGKSKTRLCDGGNLFLHVETNASGKINRRWFFRYGFDGQTHDMGLGSLDSVGLAAARRRATELR
jgi:Arm DNA-binding domain